MTVRQVTDATAIVRRAPQNAIAGRASVIVAATSTSRWRRIDGAFQFIITISTKEQLLLSEERTLAKLRWMLLHTPKNKRWYPVLHRYIGDVAGRVHGFGGNPGQILPSARGEVPGLHLSKWRHHGHHLGEREDEEKFSGKIDAVIYDHFGDFEGFILETESGLCHRFATREPPMLLLVMRAWHERTRVTVFPERHDRHRPRTIILRGGKLALVGRKMKCRCRG